MRQNQPQRVLPADIYDTIEFGALVHGGIGAGRMCEDDGVTGYCVHGIAMEAEGGGYGLMATGVVREALNRAGIGVSDNDAAVRAINRRKGLGWWGAKANARVSFEEWCAELGVVRGDA